MPQLGCQASSSFTTRQPPELPLSIGVLDTSGEEVFVIRRAPVAQLDRASDEAQLSSPAEPINTALLLSTVSTI